MIFAMLGEAGPSVIIGYLMGLFTANMLFYSLLVISLILFVLFERTLKLLEQNQTLSKNEKNAS